MSLGISKYPLMMPIIKEISLIVSMKRFRWLSVLLRFAVAMVDFDEFLGKISRLVTKCFYRQF